MSQSYDSFVLPPALEARREQIRSGQHRALRQERTIDILAECDAEALSWMQRSARLTRRMCEAELPVILDGERILFTRTLPAVPPIYSEQQWNQQTEGHIVHELGPISNICADWGEVLRDGLSGRRNIAQNTLAAKRDDPQAREFLECAIDTIDAVTDLGMRYAIAAEQRGMRTEAQVMRNVMQRAPQTFREALQLLRLCHSVVWMSAHYHVGLGRLDQYLWPFLRDDLAMGRTNEHEAFELLAEFFIALNKDSDLYPGVQQGDNGQSMMLGGCTPDGADGVNPLTYLALRAGRAVAMIDPKINLRVTQHTDQALLELAAELTRMGLGFPQYCNDDVVIPSLVQHGYRLEDARNYTVAACWEFILPGKGMEIVNIGAVSMPAAADNAIRTGLSLGWSFEQILQRVSQSIHEQLDVVKSAYDTLLIPPAPYYSVLMTGCLESGRDLSTGLRYNNFGVHGACATSAADALAAVKTLVYEQRQIAPDQLLAALDANWREFDSLRDTILQRGPKVGNDDDRADHLLVWLYEQFAQACKQAGANPRGGIYRPGTGSAMYYVWLARGHKGMREPVVGATADGRRSGEYFSANLAPSPSTRTRGPISVLQSYAKIDYRNVCNGGPVTIELSDSVFAGEEGLSKVAAFIRAMARMGCQQMQLNTLNVETLKDARAHPERHRDLIVRVWGWSGYYCELDAEYQEQILARHMHAV